MGRTRSTPEAPPDPLSRKRSGSFYTPPPLAEAITRLALDPLVRRARRAPDPGAAIRRLRVLDPSCGPGVFLVAAARRLAGSLGGGRGSAGETMPGILSCSIHGVDTDAHAVAQCRERLAALAPADGRLGAPLGRHIRIADALAEWPTPSDAAGWDAVLGNPPFLFAEHRPRADVSRFTLARGSWDASWLFLELAMERSAQGATIALILPESIAVRTACAPVRAFIRERAAALDLVWTGQVFGAGIAPIAWIIRKATTRGGAGSPRVRAWAFEDGGLTPREVPRLLVDWLAAPRARRAVPSPDSDLVPLHHIARIQVGEVEGKRSLRRLTPGERDAGQAGGAVHAVLTGDSPRGPTRQALPTHDLGHPARKSADRYAAPKVVVVKTGRSLRVGIDRRGYPALQSLYCLHVLPAARRDGWTEARLARALAEPGISDRFIRPFTEAKDLFPQITVTMLRQVMLPRRPR